MMPVFASIVVQMVELSLPAVKSVDLELALRVVIRKTDVMQTLDAVSMRLERNYWCLQDAESKDNGQAPLLSIGKLQTSHHRHRKQQNSKVSYDICGSVGVPECSKVDATAFSSAVPNSLHRGAFEDGSNDTGDSIQYHVRHHEVNASAEPADVGKDTQI